MSLVCLILENGAVCWDPYNEGQINALDCVQKKVAKFANHMSDLVWETLVQSRKIVGICVLFKAYTREQAWQSIGERLKDHATRAGMIMIIKLGPGRNKEQTLLNTVL